MRFLLVLLAAAASVLAQNPVVSGRLTDSFGAANTGTYNNQVSAMPMLDSIQEFKVNTSPYAAEFGRTGGGVVSFSIKSSTNALHGTVHEFDGRDGLP